MKELHLPGLYLNFSRAWYQNASNESITIGTWHALEKDINKVQFIGECLMNPSKDITDITNRSTGMHFDWLCMWASDC